MKVYRLKHVPSGMYYVPSRKVAKKDESGRTWYVKSNLSKKGKIYPTKPSLRWVSSYYHPDDQPTSWSSRYSVRKSEEGEWVVEEV